MKLQHFPHHLLVVFLVLAAGIGFAGYRYHEYQKELFRKERQKDLDAVAKLKANEIFRWRHDLLRDAEVLFQSPFSVQQVKQWTENPGARSTEFVIRQWLESVRSYHESSGIVLMDKDGSTMVSAPPGILPDPQVAPLIPVVRGSDKPLFVDLYRSANEEIRCGILVPVRDPNEDNAALVGILFLVVDPDISFYPFIQTWPSPSASSETLLVRREGDEVLYLNELRHRKGTALRLRMPLNDWWLPASMAVRGVETVVEGMDYRGVPVLASLRGIPDSPWFLVAKVDLEEVLTPLQQRPGIIAVLVGVLIAGSGLFLGLIWTYQNARVSRSQYESELHRLELAQRFKHMMMYANDIILLADVEGIIVEANQRAVAAYGYPHRELLGLNLKDLADPDSLPLFESQMDLTREKDGHLFEVNHRTKDGHRFPVEISARLIELRGSRFYWCTIQDIRERKEAQEALRQSEERLNLITNSLPVLIAYVDRDRRYRFVNKEYERWFGIPRSRIMGMSVKELLGEASYGLVMDHVAGVLRGEAVSFEGAMQPGGGAPRYFLAEYVPHLAPDGQVPGYFALVQDITHRKEAEDALRRSEERFKQLIEHSPVAVIVTDQKGTVEYLNRKFLFSFGYTLEEISTLAHWWPLACSDDVQRGEVCRQWETAMEHAFRENRELEPCRYEVRSKDGTVRVVEMYGAPIGDKHLVVFTDITEHETAQAQLRKYRDHLESLVEERTASLVRVNRQLEQEIRERGQIAAALMESEASLRRLSAQLLSTQEEERQRIALELHDSIGQSLAAVKFSIENVLRLLRRDGVEAAQLLDPLVPMVQGSIEEVRSIYTGLRPSLLDDLGIAATIGWFCREFQKTHPTIAVEQRFSAEEAEIPVPPKIVIFRVVQEAMNTIARSPQVSRVSLILEKDDAALTLTIMNDEKGFSPEDVPGVGGGDRGVGLRSIQERVELSGGSFRAESAEMQGTRIHASWPS